MDQQARRFRDPAEQDRIIARERERGHTVTREELARAADGMQQGAERMRQSAETMRRSAERMRASN